jgi:acetyl-CoA synthetase
MTSTGSATDQPQSGSVSEIFRAARDFLLQHRTDYDTAVRDFRWPQFEHFNWALDWFDGIARDNPRPALVIVEEDGRETRRTFAEMATRSNRVANWLREHGVVRGDRIIVMLGNQVELWETTLAALKLGAVIIPAATLLRPVDLQDRVERGQARHVVARAADTATFAKVGGDYTRIAVGDRVEGWLAYADADAASSAFAPDGATRATDPLLLYFTSGTTALPKLVEHT